MQFVQDTDTDKHKHDMQSVQKEEQHKGSECMLKTFRSWKITKQLSPVGQVSNNQGRNRPSRFDMGMQQ